MITNHHLPIGVLILIIKSNQSFVNIYQSYVHIYSNVRYGIYQRPELGSGRVFFWKKNLGQDVGTRLNFFQQPGSGSGIVIFSRRDSGLRFKKNNKFTNFTYLLKILRKNQDWTGILAFFRNRDRDSVFYQPEFPGQDFFSNFFGMGSSGIQNSEFR